MRSSQLRKAIEAEVSNGPKDLNILGWLGRSALELIGQGCLGYSFDPLVRNEPNIYGEALKSYM